ncbi:MAG: hypothetical protein RID81_07285 [Sandaracinaceae bacterium]
MDSAKIWTTFEAVIAMVDDEDLEAFLRDAGCFDGVSRVHELDLRLFALGYFRHAESEPEVWLEAAAFLLARSDARYSRERAAARARGES